ncbi:ubiquitin carboxyl-terminal hydrolase, family 1 [Thozetella sp. PMI_491]|nr:ubiquitin carboxyl-terminal hydrolase, family 1 [Thozetella sp. PMI_491]
MASTSVDTHSGPDPASTAPAFIPLEANPELMTSLIHKLGVSPALSIHDVYSLDDPSLLAFLPRPTLALLLVFPVSATYESHRLSEDALTSEYMGAGPDEPVVWFRQTIRNACGLMGLLHAVANGPAKEYITEGSDLDVLLKKAIPLAPPERAKLLETDSSLAKAHHSAASQGDTSAPDAKDDVDLHYVCFAKGHDGTLWELDGRRKGPINRGKLDANEDVLSEKAVLLGPKKFLEREGADLRFSLVALAPSLD